MSADTRRKRGAVPTSRLGRALRFGMLTGELALSAAVGTARQFSSGKPLNLNAAMLTPGNAEILARRLAVLRGPAMKLGQLISLSGEELVPEEFRRALDVLRSQGYAMPDSQLRRVLGREYGKGWQSRFAHFDLEPVAAASIGQIEVLIRGDELHVTDAELGGEVDEGVLGLGGLEGEAPDQIGGGRRVLEQVSRRGLGLGLGR